MTARKVAKLYFIILVALGLMMLGIVYLDYSHRVEQASNSRDACTRADSDRSSESTALVIISQMAVKLAEPEKAGVLADQAADLYDRSLIDCDTAFPHPSFF